MVDTKSFGTLMSLAMASFIVSGCGATQSAAFRQMSAADHDAEAKALQSDPPAAADHIAAAQQLRETERATCVNIPDEDRLDGPFAHPDRVVKVTVIRDRPFPKGMLQPVGIAVYVRADPGMTEQLLYRITECHLAHYAVVGRRDTDQSPLAVNDPKIKVNVSSTLDGFRVAITSRDIDATRSLVARGEELGRRANVQIARE
jgi:hypothetical protein